MPRPSGWSLAACRRSTPGWATSRSISRLVPDVFVLRVFDVMTPASRHRFHLLTKRPETPAGMSARLLGFFVR